ncbi:unnamed protein product [Aphanomyces euteiches]
MSDTGDAPIDYDDTIQVEVMDVTSTLHRMAVDGFILNDEDDSDTVETNAPTHEGCKAVWSPDFKAFCFGCFTLQAPALKGSIIPLFMSMANATTRFHQAKSNLSRVTHSKV